MIVNVFGKTHCCNYSNAPNISVRLLVLESTLVSFFTTSSMVSDKDWSGIDFDIILVKSKRLRSVCSSKIVSATFIHSNITSDRSRTISLFNRDNERVKVKVRP